MSETTNIESATCRYCGHTFTSRTIAGALKQLGKHASEEYRMSHDDREPVCDCDEPVPKTLGEGTPVEFQACRKCLGIVRE